MNFKKLKIFFFFCSTVQCDFMLALLALNSSFHPSLWEISEQVIRHPAFVGTLSQLICSQVFLHLPQILRKTLHTCKCGWLTQTTATPVLLGCKDRVLLHECYKQAYPPSTHMALLYDPKSMGQLWRILSRTETDGLNTELLGQNTSCPGGEVTDTVQRRPNLHFHFFVSEK